MDFVFYRTAEGRAIKSLTVVDDTTHEAVAVVLERAIGGHMLTPNPGSNWSAAESAKSDPHRQWKGALW